MIEIYGDKPRVRSRVNGFTLSKRQRFLDALALTCNVHRAAAIARVDQSTVYRARRRDAAFAEQWRAALDIGYDRLEALALEHGGACASLGADPTRAEAADAAAPFDFDRAMKLLSFHRASRERRSASAKGGAPLRNATREETNALLLKALAAAKLRIEKARLREG